MKGYVAQSQVALGTAGPGNRRTTNSARPRANSGLFRRFEVPKGDPVLAGPGCETAEINQRVQVRPAQGSSSIAWPMIRKQVENCIDATPPGRRGRVFEREVAGGPGPLEPGVRVYQDQEMFLLPDLSHMEVEVSVNEWVGPRGREWG